MQTQGWKGGMAALIGSVLLASVSFSVIAFGAPIESVPGEFVVKLRPQISLQSVNVNSMARALGGSIKTTFPEHNLVVVKRPVIEIAAYAVKALNNNPNVVYAEPNFIYRINKVPNDPMLKNLWGLHNEGQVDSANHTGAAGVDIDAEKAWDITTGSSDVIVAVIDTGADYNHPDLQDNMWTNQAELNGKPGVDDDNNGYIDDIHGMNFVNVEKPVADPMDDQGHGSHCSGVIGAKGDDGKGIVGVNWNVRIMPVKFLGSDGGGTLDGAVKAIDYAHKMGAKIMSNSWGGGGFSQALKDVIDSATKDGVLFVAAAGNDSSNNDSTPSYPASYENPNILTVAAIDNMGNLASFSNYGKKSVNIAAPGVNIYSSILNGGYDSWSGTSMATPHVSGVAALVLAHEPKMTAQEIKQRLIATVRLLPGVRGKVSSGGLVNAYNALTNTQAPPDQDDPSNWTSQPFQLSTAHPYANNANETYEVSVPGAKQIAIYFDKFETERGYDKVTFTDRGGKVLGQMSGMNSESYSPIFDADYVKITFTSDDSATKYGFDITKVSYR